MLRERKIPCIIRVQTRNECRCVFTLRRWDLLKIKRQRKLSLFSYWCLKLLCLKHCGSLWGVVSQNSNLSICKDPTSTHGPTTQCWRFQNLTSCHAKSIKNPSKAGNYITTSLPALYFQFLLYFSFWRTRLGISAWRCIL